VASHLLRFGVLFCPDCVGMREFVSYDATCKHITDAFCCDCGFVFGRYDCIDELAGLRSVADGGVEPGEDPRIHIRGAKVISDEQARAAALRLGHGAIDMAAAAAALLPPPPPPWKPGIHAVPTGAEPPPAAAPAPSPPPRVRPSSPEVVGGRSDEFLRYFKRERGDHGRT